VHLYTTATEADLRAIAANMNIDLYQFDTSAPTTRGKYAGRNRFKFLLRPLGDEYRLIRDDPYTRAGTRRVWAVSWRGHRDFMRAVYAIDANATFRTAIDTWRDAEDFERRHHASGDRNVGSMLRPQSYAGAE
jgi:hypothetical protein